jgi:excisionase family DNA binding protein
MNGLMNVREAAKFLNMGATRLYQMAKKGEIPAFKVGGSWKFDPDKLKEWWREEALIQERQREK